MRSPPHLGEAAGAEGVLRLRLQPPHGFDTMDSTSNGVDGMDLFMKLLLLLSGLFFCLVGGAFFLRWKGVVQWVQKRKFGRTAEPRKEEKYMARIMGALLFGVGLYYVASALFYILSA
jgi:hypothetical protein